MFTCQSIKEGVEYGLSDWEKIFERCELRRFFHQFLRLNAGEFLPLQQARKVAQDSIDISLSYSLLETCYKRQYWRSGGRYGTLAKVKPDFKIGGQGFQKIASH